LTGRWTITPDARQDLLDQAEYISEGNPEMGDRFYETANATFDRLAKMPGMGAPRRFAAAGLDELRMVPIRGFERHLVFYRPTAGGVEVIRVLHSSRDLESLLKEE
jgi:toxin ParE1/3/4